jgi:aspartate aminotransferase-like enzyme
MKAYEQGTPAYFATPPVNLIYALNASLTTIAKSSETNLEERFELHKEASQRVKSAAKKLGLTQVSDPEHAANGMTAVSCFSFQFSKRFLLNPRRLSSTSLRATPPQTFSHGSQPRG